MKTSIFKQSGIATVELAIATPFLLVMLLVTSEFSRAFYEYNTLTKAVRDAARYAVGGSIDGTGQLQLSDNTKTEAANIAAYGNIAGSGAPILKNFNAGQVTVEQYNIGASPVLEHVQVTASYDFVPLSPTLSGMGFLTQDFNLNFTLVARSTMRGL